MSSEKDSKRGPFSLTTPCESCPFRNDIDPFLTKSRVREIQRSLVDVSFPCHKTTEFDDDDNYIHTMDEINCAGSLILLEKLGRPSQMMRIGERLHLYDRKKLNMNAPVYDTFAEMIKAQTR